MQHKVKHRLAILTLATALSAGTVVPVSVFADSASIPSSAESLFEIPSIGSVSIGGSNTIEVKQAGILSGDDGKTLNFTVTVHNNGEQEIQFIDYWVRVRNKSGIPFSVQLMPQDKDKNRVSGNGTLDVSFYAKLNDSTNLNDLVFSIVKWDFSSPNYERTLGDIAVPDDYTRIAPVNASQNVKASGTVLNTWIDRATIKKTDKGLVPSIYFKMDNVGSKGAVLPNYQYYVKTGEGLSYPLEVTGPDAVNKNIYPRFTKELILTGIMPEFTSGENMELVITMVDESTKMTLPVASYKIPPISGAVDVPSVKLYDTKTIEFDVNKLEATVKKFTKNKNEKFYQTITTLNLKNAGTASFTVPKYRFFIQTADELTYPVTVEKFDNVTIDPLVSKELTLNVSIPSTVAADKWKLLMVPAAPTDKNTPDDKTPVAVFDLPDSTLDGSAPGNVYSYSNTAGTYTMALKEIERLPWEDQDIVSAGITISNSGEAALPIPSLTGYFLFDEAVKVPFKVIQRDNVLSVKQGSDLGLQLLAKIPYTNEYSSVKVVLQEKVDSTVNDITQFTHNDDTVSMPVIGIGNSFDLTGSGRQANLSIRSVRSYSGAEADLYTVQLDVKNLEKRFSGLANLVGYFKTKDDLMFPANISVVKKKISPQGKATLYVSTPLGREIDRSGMQLIVGEGVKDNKLAEAETPDAYVNAVAFQLPSEPKEPKTDFNNLDLFPYTISLSNFSASIPSKNQALFSFKYKLMKNMLVESNMDDHQIILEFTDTSGSISFSKTYSFDKEGGFKQGEDTINIIENDPAIMLKIQYINDYKVNVYDQYLGQKKLLASQTFGWFTTSD